MAYLKISRKKTSFFLTRIISIHNRWVLFLSLYCMIVLTNLDTTMINLALAKIACSLNLNLNDAQAILNCFLASAVISFVFFGKLSDCYGPFPIYKIGILIYFVGTLICIFSYSGHLLVLGRIIQGFGFSASFSMALLLINQSCIHDKNRSLVLGSTTMLSGIAQAIGPSLSATIIKYSSWKGLFCLEFFLVFSALIFAFLSSAPLLKNNKKAYKLDSLGLVLWAAFILVLQLIAQLESLQIRLFFFCSCLLVSFIFTKYSKSLNKKSIVLHEIFSSPGYQASIHLRVISMSYFSMILFLCPLYLQNILNYSFFSTSLILLTMTSFYAITSLFYGLLERRVVVSLKIAPLLQVLSIFLMIFSIVLRDLRLMIIGLACSGISFGIAMPQSLKCFFQSSTASLKGNLFSLFCTFSFLASFLVISISSLIIEMVSRQWLKSSSKIAPLAYKHAVKVAQGLNNPQVLQDTALALKACTSFEVATIVCFCLCGFFTINTLKIISDRRVAIFVNKQGLDCKNGD